MKKNVVKNVLIWTVCLLVLFLSLGLVLKFNRRNENKQTMILVDSVDFTSSGYEELWSLNTVYTPSFSESGVSVGETSKPSLIFDSETLTQIANQGYKSVSFILHHNNFDCWFKVFGGNDITNNLVSGKFDDGSEIEISLDDLYDSSSDTYSIIFSCDGWWSENNYFTISDFIFSMDEI